MLDTKKITWEDFKNLPWWAWVFVVACVIIPISTLGGAIPAAVAAVGVISCVRISSSPKMETWAKILACFGITAAAWVLTYLFLSAVQGLLN